MTRRPDARVVVEQLLLAYLSTPRTSALRAKWVGLGGYAQLRAAGLTAQRARGVNYMLRRVALDWRKNRNEPSEEELADAARRLLL